MYNDFCDNNIERELFDIKELVKRKARQISDKLESCNLEKINKNTLREFEYILFTIYETQSNSIKNEIKEAIERIYKNRHEISKLIRGILVEGKIEDVNKLKEFLNSAPEETTKILRESLLNYLIIGRLDPNRNYEVIIKYMKCMEEEFKKVFEKSFSLEDFFHELLTKHILLSEETVFKLLKRYSDTKEEKIKKDYVKKILEKLEEIGALFHLEEYEKNIKRFYIKFISPLTIFKYLQLVQDESLRNVHQMFSLIIESYVAEKLSSLKSIDIEIYAFPSNQKGADLLLKVNRDLNEHIIPIEVKVGRKRVGKAIKQVAISMKKYNSPYGIIINGKDDITIYFPINISSYIIQIPYQYLIFLD